MVRFRDLAFVHSIRHPMQDDDVPSLLFTANPQPWCTSARKKMAIKMERFSMVLILALALALAGMGHVSGASYKWHVTVGQRAQDCYSRPVLLINGQFQPTLELTAGEELEVYEYPVTIGPTRTLPTCPEPAYSPVESFLPAVDPIQRFAC